jgi:hypothetical protein
VTDGSARMEDPAPGQVSLAGSAHDESHANRKIGDLTPPARGPVPHGGQSWDLLAPRGPQDRTTFLTLPFWEKNLIGKQCFAFGETEAFKISRQLPAAALREPNGRTSTKKKLMLSRTSHALCEASEARPRRKKDLASV